MQRTNNTSPCLVPLLTQLFRVIFDLVFTCNGVEEHEVLKVGDLSSLPALRHVGRLEQLTRGGQRNPPAETHTHIHK